MGDRVKADVELMVGGNFAVDHVGPDVYDQVTARFHARAADYVMEATRLAKRSSRAWLSSSYTTFLLGQAAKLEGSGARAAAHELLPLYEKALADAKAAPGDDSESVRLARRVADLKELTQ